MLCLHCCQIGTLMQFCIGVVVIAAQPSRACVLTVVIGTYWLVIEHHHPTIWQMSAIPEKIKAVPTSPSVEASPASAIKSSQQSENGNSQGAKRVDFGPQSKASRPRYAATLVGAVSSPSQSKK